MNEKKNAFLDSLMEEDLSTFYSEEDASQVDTNEDESLDSLRQQLLDALSHMNLDDEDDDTEDADKEADQYHNAATEHARHGRNRDAVKMCVRGLEKFPANVDLLADVIKYASDAGDMDTARRYFPQLMDIPREEFNWRAYTFLLDYLMQDMVVNKELCRALVADYQRYLPFEEKAYVAESKLEEKLGNHDRSLEILENTIQKLPNAPQAALRLADKQFDRGRYEEVTQTVAYAFVASSESQPSINISYLVFLRVLAEDAVLHQRLMRNEPVTKEQIEEMRGRYQTFKEAFPLAALRFKEAINDRIGILTFAVPTA